MTKTEVFILLGVAVFVFGVIQGNPLLVALPTVVACVIEYLYSKGKLS